MAGIQRWMASSHSMINIEEWICYTKQSMNLKFKDSCSLKTPRKILTPGHLYVWISTWSIQRVETDKIMQVSLKRVKIHMGIKIWIISSMMHKLWFEIKTKNWYLNTNYSLLWCCWWSLGDITSCQDCLQKAVIHKVKNGKEHGLKLS